MAIIGHGIDAVEVARIAGLLEHRGERFGERCFTPDERAYADSSKRRVEHYAVRFAAKEAVMKALGTGWAQGVGWTDAEVTRDPSGRPGLLLHGVAARIAAELGVERWSLSLTHTETIAFASVIAEGGASHSHPANQPP
ncbi:MAG: holo-ACP synthase [Phycisphaerales bacterium]|nr:holo-ACP synthase [Phycisphaerales bacterium]